MKYFLLILILTIILFSCSKRVGKNPSLAYSDFALLDSCLNTTNKFYKNNSTRFLTGNPNSNGQHGVFKLRFNSIAYAALTDSGKLPLNVKMPEGALIVKDVYVNGKLDLYAFMYKYSGSWLWAEIRPNKEVIYSVTKTNDICINCHSQQGNRDYLRTFDFY
jgi:hypothetical protein